MRITGPLRRDQSIREIQDNLSRMAQLQTQVATGHRFNRVEEDPLGAAQVLRLQRGLRGLEQYGRNATAAQVRLGAEEAVLTQVGDLMGQAREFALSFGKGNPPYTADQVNQRQIALAQINRVLDDVVSLGNTKIGNEYILAGGNSTTPPFNPTAGATFGDYQGTTAARQIQIADGVSVTPNHTGNEYVGPAIAALKALRDAVDPANNQTEAAVQTQVNTAYDAGQQLLVAAAESGVVGNQILNMANSQAAQKTDMENIRGKIQDISIEEAGAKLLSLQTTIQASYSATSRLLSLSLTNYLP